MSILETVDYYRNVMESLGYTVRGNRVLLISDDGEEDVMIDGKQLVLPDETFLSNPKWSTEIPFHPLCENPQRGESEVVRTVLDSVVGNLNVALLGVMIHLYTSVACIKDSKVLNTEQSMLLPFIPAVNDKVRKAVMQLTEKVTLEDDQSSLILCNLRRRCPLGGVKFERVSVVRFPFADMDRKQSPYGMSTAAQFDTLRGLMDFILPGWEVDDTYSVGTNSFVAPYFTSVMLMYTKMATRLNEVIELYRDIEPKLMSYHIGNVEKIQAAMLRDGYMERLRDSIPPLEGNKGSLDVPRQQNTSYKIDQPAQTVDLPWNDRVEEVAKAAEQQRTPGADEVPYTPGSVTPQALVQQTIGVLNPLGGHYDPNSFHGRQMAKQALMHPLSQQLNQVGAVGGSPFLENAGANGSEYRPGALTQARQQQALQNNQQGTNIGTSGLGF